MACGQGPGGPPDGDAGADTGEGGLAVEPPNIPWLDDGFPPIARPDLTPCPEGWNEVMDEAPEGGVNAVSCAPYGDETGGTEPDTCPDGWAHFSGDAGCTPVGVPCPSGDFPEGLPPDADILYVLSSALPGGDGTIESPLSTITDAMVLGSAGTIIAIGKGEYDEAVRLRPGIVLWGACARDTRLTASSPGLLAQGVITAPAPDTHLKNLRLGPADLPGLVVFGAGTSVSVEGVIIEGVQQVGLQVLAGGRAQGRELMIRRTRPEETGRLGRGVAVVSGGQVTLARLLVSENHDAGVFVAGSETSVGLSDVVVRDTRATERDGEGGRGLTLQSGATATVSRGLFAFNREYGVHAVGEGTSVTLSDVVVRDTQGRRSDGARGRGLSVNTGATATVARSLLLRNHDVGVYVGRASTSATLSDLIVLRTLSQQSDDLAGHGLAVRSGARAEVARALISESHEVGVLVSEEATLVLSDAFVQETLGQVSDGAAGRGLGVQSGATAEVSRAVVSRSRDLGVLVGGEGTTATLSDVLVHGTRGRESDGEQGGGLNVQSGATVEVTRALISQNRDLSVLALGSSAVVRLSDVVVTQTHEQVCSVTTCADRPFGVGLAAGLEASLVATRFEVRDSVLCGVMVVQEGEVDLSAGRVSGSRIGACLQVDGYALRRLTDRVVYVDNDINLDTTSLPVPRAAPAVSEI